MSTPESTAPWTVARLLAWTRSHFAGRGVESARLEAEILLAHACSTSRIELYARSETVPSQEQLATFRRLVQERAAGTPAAYLVGAKEFFSLSLRVTPDVLIPRPETEWVVAGFCELARDLSNPRILDVGTGSGNIALACLAQHPSATAWACDISQPALAVARANAQTLGLADRVEWGCGDLFAPIPPTVSFHFLLSNPPYIPSRQIADLDKQVAAHEPHGALDGGPDGLEIVRQLVRQGSRFVVPSGHLLCEIGAGQEAAVRSILDQCPEWSPLPSLRDLAGIPRVVRAVRRPTVPGNSADTPGETS